METETPTFKRKTIITADAMNTLCFEDVLVGLRIFLRREREMCPDYAMACDRNGSSFWIIRERDGAITVCCAKER